MAIKLKTTSNNISLQTENDKLNFSAPTVGGSVFSVNGKVGDVVLNAADVGALPDTTVIPSVEGLATETYVDDKIAAIPKTDLTDYAKKSDLNGLATEQYVNEAIEGIDEVDLTPYAKKDDLKNYATKSYVTQQIAEIPEPDLSPYAKTADLNNYAKKTDIKGMATETYVDQKIEAIPEPDLTPYAKKTDLNSYAKKDDLNSYATQSYVNQQIAAIPEPDLTGYATEDYVDAAIGNIDLPGGGGFIAQPEAPEDKTLLWVDTDDESEDPSLAISSFTNDVGYQTEAQVIALINAKMPTSGDEVSY